MPYGRRYYHNGYRRSRKYKRYRRRPYKKPVRYKVADYAYDAFKMGKKLMRYVNTETKYFDNAPGPIGPDINGTLIPLDQIPQGDTDQSRDGDSVKLMSLTFNIIVGNPSANTILRYIIFIDKQNSISTVGQFLQQVGSTQAINSPKNYDKRFKTKTLLDSSIIVNVNNNTFLQKKHHINLNQHIQFEGGTTTVDTNSIKLILISNNTGILVPAVEYYSRLHYVDN